MPTSPPTLAWQEGRPGWCITVLPLSNRTWLSAQLGETPKAHGSPHVRGPQGGPCGFLHHLVLLARLMGRVCLCPGRLRWGSTLHTETPRVGDLEAASVQGP